MSEVSVLIERFREGDEAVTPALFSAVYDELRDLAASLMRREWKAESIQATALVNEAYCRLIGEDLNWQGRSHFFGIAARVMRRILIEHARARSADKRGGGQTLLVLDEALDSPALDGAGSIDLLALDIALEALASINERAARIVELRFFAGLSIDETAEALGFGSGTVKRDWAFAKAFLKRQMGGA